jgi:hypothetical protein
MTEKKVKIRTKTILMASAFAFVIGSMSILPAFAHNPPYKDLYWFSTEDPELCFQLIQLNNLTVDGNTGQGTSVMNEVKVARDTINTAVTGLTIRDVGSSCDQSFVEVGAKSLGWFVMAQTQTTVVGSNNEYLEAEFDFATGYNWGIETDVCDWTDDKDPEWIANNELGHALSLAHHSGTDHSMMGGSCSGQWETIRSVDDSALETRY